MQSSLQNIFSSYVKQRPLFSDKNTLSVSYSPGNIPHRERQIEQLGRILAPCLRGERPSNVFSYGKTGTGKTLCVKHVLQELEVAAKENRRCVRTVFVNCKMRRVGDTVYRVLAQLCKSFGKDVPATGLPTEKLYEIFYTAIDQEEQNVIIILDEIDALIKKTGDEILYNLTRINQDLARSRVTIIGITNDLSFANYLDPRVKSSLSEEEMVFQPYNALELRDILDERTKLAFFSGAVAPGVVAKCSALAAQEHGDARRALDLLRVSGEIAERGGERVVTEKHVDLAQEKINTDGVFEVIKAQPRQSQAILWSILKIWETGGNITTGDVYDFYKNACKKHGLAPLGQRRASDLISELGMLGLLDVKIISKGRYGRTREIRFTLPDQVLKDIKSVLQKDFYFE